MQISDAILQKINAMLSSGDRVEIVKNKNGDIYIKAVKRKNIAVLSGERLK